MIRRPPRSTLLTHSFPTRRSSDLLAQDSRAHPVATIEQARKSHCPSPEGEGRILSDEELADPFGAQRRLVLALDLDREFERLLPLARAFLVQFEQFEMAAQIGRASCREKGCRYG